MHTCDFQKKLMAPERTSYDGQFQRTQKACDRVHHNMMKILKRVNGRYFVTHGGKEKNEREQRPL